MVDHGSTRGVRPDARVSTRGVVFVHSCPRALAAHVEWALADILDSPVHLDWRRQPVLDGEVRAELSWTGRTGVAADVVSNLHGWGRIRLEVTEEPTATTEGQRYAATPVLGIFRATVGLHGDIQVPEERLRGAIARAALSGTAVEDEIGELLGARWDAELEPFRYAGEGAAVRWLHQVVS